MCTIAHIIRNRSVIYRSPVDLYKIRLAGLDAIVYSQSIHTNYGFQRDT